MQNLGCIYSHVLFVVEKASLCHISMWHLKLLSKNRQFMAAVKMCSTLPLTLHGNIWGWTFTRIEGYLPVWRGVLEFQRRQTKKTQPSGKTANLSTNKTPQQNLANENHFHHKFKSTPQEKQEQPSSDFYSHGFRLKFMIINYYHYTPKT